MIPEKKRAAPEDDTPVMTLRLSPGEWVPMRREPDSGD
ncbi:hypothetical protein LEJE111609_20355 [Lelliottia jeotgali]